METKPTPTPTLIDVVQAHYIQARQDRQIQEAVDMANRPGQQLRRHQQAELEAARRQLAREKQRFNTMLNLMLIAMILAFAISLVSICLTIGMVLR